VLYGNSKLRPPFPPLEDDTSITHFGSEPAGGESSRLCSVCNRPFDGLPHRVWVSLLVATDVLPLLVNACSEACIEQLPTPAEGYVPRPHRGGLDLVQPPAEE
jgi:hypothetical protein